MKFKNHNNKKVGSGIRRNLKVNLSKFAHFSYEVHNHVSEVCKTIFLEKHDTLKTGVQHFLQSKKMNGRPFFIFQVMKKFE